MLNTNELRTAVTSTNPTGALENLARRELSLGQTREHLSDAIAGLMPELRSFPDYTDQWEDHLVEVVDRLTDWTQPVAQIHQPPAKHSANGAPADGVVEKLPH